MSDELKLPLDRNIFFCEQVDQESINKVTKRIIEINENDKYLKELYHLSGIEYRPKPIKVWIDSYGGNVYQIMGLVGIIEFSETEVYTIATGAAMSCGFVLLISGHKRFALPHATPMYHQVSSIAASTVQDMEEDLNETKRLQKWIEDLTLRRTKISKSKLAEIRKTKFNWFFTQSEMLSYGIVDSIIKSINSI